MDPFVGEIRAVGFNFAPRGWALCDGSLLPIRQNTALFSILGTQFGGDGQSTFGLPDLRGRAIVNPGQGPGLSAYAIGAKAGVESVTLSIAQTPAHIHGFGGQLNINPTPPSNAASPTGNYIGIPSQAQYSDTPGTATMAANSVTGTVGAVGSGQAHENRQPYLPMYYVIALQGEFPQRP
jgi:microcystin-dependent protein